MRITIALTLALSLLACGGKSNKAAKDAMPADATTTDATATDAPQSTPPPKASSARADTPASTGARAPTT
jgi:hypothetical protein